MTQLIANEETDKRAAELANKEQESVAKDLTQLIDTANAPIFGIV